MPRIPDPRPRARRLLTKLRSNVLGRDLPPADRATLDRGLCSLISDYEKGDETRAIWPRNLKDPKRKRA